MPKRPATLDDQVWWIKAARSFFAFSLTSTTSSRLIKTQKSRPIFSRVEASHLVNNYAMPYFFVPRPWNADYRINHNCNKSFNDDWLSTFLNSALIGLYAWCQSNWTVRAIAHAHLNDYLSLPAKKKNRNFLIFKLRKPKILQILFSFNSVCSHTRDKLRYFDY